MPETFATHRYYVFFKYIGHWAHFQEMNKAGAEALEGVARGRNRIKTSSCLPFTEFSFLNHKNIVFLKFFST